MKSRTMESVRSEELPHHSEEMENYVERSDFVRGLMIGSLVGVILGLFYAHQWRMSFRKDDENREGPEREYGPREAATPH